MDNGTRHLQTVPTDHVAIIRPGKGERMRVRIPETEVDTLCIMVVRGIKVRGCPCPERPTAVSSPRPILSKRSRNVHACALRFGVTQKDVYHPSHGMTYAGNCGTVNPGTFGPSLCHAVHIDDISRTHVVSVPVMIIKYGPADYR